MTGNILVIAPHADDEVLGVGGTIARLSAEGSRITVAILTSGLPPEYTEDEEDLVRSEAARAHSILGAYETVYLGFRAAGLDLVPHRELNLALGDLYQRVRPDHVFVPFYGDVHRDHQAAFQSAMVMCRPNGGHVPRTVLAYETLSETNWNAPPITAGFLPNTYIDISNYLDIKLSAFKAYASQVRPFPNERSLDSLKALAMLRGSTVGLNAAEAFVTVRNLI